ncbi:diacylglycerol/lipid kinase family protein [Pedobacter hartonius]|uniref:Lipid kinase, YegS/Rv2252/BmrU family n=1 Tax=Pedobacter hartonius TaxID=425514 RepID=A0A1H4HIY2_9SPHI|nr:diacylglycerol kinase family protein [Pedobacter hartonius]SEB21783.1 lipid kinase, YegS/Rv2252/BmrU family [Pedobacter hartonius]
MTAEEKEIKLLFIVNPGSGSDDTDFNAVITDFFSSGPHTFGIYELQKDCNLDQIKAAISEADPDRVVAVGGDGTLKLVAECLQGTKIPIGIIPAGSANGMAKELGIPTIIQEALELTITGKPKEIHAVDVNGEFCIHLSDIGFNAYIVKKFDDLAQRGMLGYAKATWKALWSHHKMEVEMTMGEETISSEAAMVVIANATMYGTGVKINPEGKLDDDLFEVILVKKYSFLEILKIRFTRLPFNPEKIELFHTKKLRIKARHKAHFQIDGEYMGKVNQIDARLLPAAISVIVRPDVINNNEINSVWKDSSSAIGT